MILTSSLAVYRSRTHPTKVKMIVPEFLLRRPPPDDHGISLRRWVLKVERELRKVLPDIRY